MGKTILFSPVGGTDPISYDNCCDGSLLHICRFEKPDVIYMYMSQEILENQKKDDRYRYTINKLYEKLDKPYTINEIKKEKLTKVHDFNYFYEDFHKELQKITKEMNPDDTLIVNVSSGTPAMKSALNVMATLGEYNWKVIQVSTPVKKMNEHNHKEYDKELAWETDYDNDEGAPNRCQEVKSPNLLLIKHTENIKKLIEQYDYAAAETLAKSINNKRILSLLEMAEKRTLLETKDVNRLSKELGCEKLIPVRGEKDELAFEYALVLQIRIEKKLYSDFLRGITPVILYLFEDILINFLHVKIDKYIQKENGIEKWKFDSYDNEVYKILSDKYNGNFIEGKPVYSDNLVAIIERKAGLPNTKLIELVKGVRDIEIDVRNAAAHTMEAVTDEKIGRVTGGKKSKDIMDDIKKLFEYSSVRNRISKDSWDSYEKMNSFIIREIDKI